MSQCKSCHASIEWINLPNSNRPMAVDYEVIEVVSAAMGEPNQFMGWSVDSLERVHGRLVTDAERLDGVRGRRTFRPHWATCPHAEQHRKPPGPELSSGTTPGPEKPRRKPAQDNQLRLF